MKIYELLETATEGSTISAMVGSIPNPHISHGTATSKPSLGKSGRISSTKSPVHHSPKKQRPTDNALDMKTSLFGEGNAIKR